MKMMLVASALLSACQTVEYVKEIDKKNAVYYLYTHEEQPVTKSKREEALHKTQQKLLAAHRRQPRQVKILLNLAQVSFLLGEYADSARFSRQVLKLDLTSQQARLILIKNLLKQKKYELVHVVIEQLGTADSAMAANLEAQVAIAQENYRVAFRILQKALRRHPQSPSLLMNAGLIALRFRQLDQARAYFQQVLAKIADHPDALLHLAVVDALQKNYHAAEAKYQRLLADRKKNPAALYNLSVLKSRTQDYQAAMHALQRYDDVRGKKVGLLPAERRYLHELQKKLHAQQEMSDADIQRIAANIKAMETDKAVGR